MMAGDFYYNLVLGLGNVLLKDDGMGVWLVKELQKKSLPPGVEALEMGTGLFALAAMLRGKTRLLLVDALRGGEKPGTFYLLSSANFPSYDPSGSKQMGSLHEVGILDLLSLPEIRGKVCSWKVIGVEPQEVGPGYGLTSCLSERLPKLVNTVWQEAEAMKDWQDSLPSRCGETVWQ
jgi:hydrogenase maturation protease